MTNYIESIERACQKANPKLLELTPGCKIMLDSKEYQYCGKGIWDNDTEYSFLVDESPYLTMTINKLEILGHPITLQDILLCLGERYSIDGAGCFMMLYPQGWSMIMRENDWGGVKYDMNLSPYDQSEEVLQFLAENLTK